MTTETVLSDIELYRDSKSGEVTAVVNQAIDGVSIKTTIEVSKIADEEMVVSFFYNYPRLITEMIDTFNRRSGADE